MKTLASKTPRTGRSRALLAALVMLVACGDSLIADPSFDLWCGDELCKPWQSKGKISRVGTWHAKDYAVSLGDGATLSQLSKHDAVECIELELIADVDANAAVRVEMDFQDDGVVEYSELVPESHWAKLKYTINTPDFYDGVRFIVRKTGKGRAVVAQVRATSSDDCDGDELPLHDQPNGAFCNTTAQCASEQCEPAPLHYVEVATLPTKLDPDTLTDHSACSPCGAALPCASDEVCDVQTALDDDELEQGRRACIAAASKPIGAWCMDDAVCASGSCSQAVPVLHGTCGECTKDDDCAKGELCGVDVAAGSAARVCRAPSQRVLGELCVSGAECASGICNEGSCSECDHDHPCAEGARCGDHDTFLTAEPKLCMPGAKRRAAEEPCSADSDCHSGRCALEKPECFVPEVDCGLLRQLAGVCR